MKKNILLFMAFLSSFNLGMFCTRYKIEHNVELYKIVFAFGFIFLFFMLYKDEVKQKSKNDVE